LSGSWLTIDLDAALNMWQTVPHGRKVAHFGEAKAWRHDILRTVRMVYRFGVENRLVDENPRGS
jgi:hypothetical protein